MMPSSGETFENVFEALADTPGEAASLTLRANLLLAVRKRVKAWDMSQGQAAARLGVPRRRLNDLMRCKVDKFSLDALVNIATAAGFVLNIQLNEATSLTEKPAESADEVGVSGRPA